MINMCCYPETLHCHCHRMIKVLSGPGYRIPARRTAASPHHSTPSVPASWGPPAMYQHSQFTNMEQPPPPIPFGVLLGTPYAAQYFPYPPMVPMPVPHWGYNGSPCACHGPHQPTKKSALGKQRGEGKDTRTVPQPEPSARAHCTTICNDRSSRQTDAANHFAARANFCPAPSHPVAMNESGASSSQGHHPSSQGTKGHGSSDEYDSSDDCVRSGKKVRFSSSDDAVPATSSNFALGPQQRPPAPPPLMVERQDDAKQAVPAAELVTASQPGDSLARSTRAWSTHTSEILEYEDNLRSPSPEQPHAAQGLVSRSAQDEPSEEDRAA